MVTPRSFPLKSTTTTSSPPPPKLCSLSDVAKLLRDGSARNVIVMAGAGISTGAGIPDFRSPETGLYDNLAKYDLPYPEAIFDIDYLEERPQAFYTLAKELYPGNFNPTSTHYFFKLLQDKDLLSGVWTQNIDTLERIAGIRDDLIVEAHGSFATATCLKCRKKFDKEEIRDEIMEGLVVRCKEKPCRGKKDALIKPDIVFFGEGLPDKFFERLPDFKSCDLLLVLGTSLSVGPFNSLLHRVPPTCPRLLINLELVGEANHPWEDGFKFNHLNHSEGEGQGEKKENGQGSRDLFWKGESDKGVEELCRLVGNGWEQELKRLREEGWKNLNKGDTKSDKEEKKEEEEVEKKKVGKEKSEQVAEKVGESVAVVEKDNKEREEEQVEELTKAAEGVKL
ncbi:hypothetical protein JCM5350_008221 [Sporobolomyces pararoseus]